MGGIIWLPCDRVGGLAYRDTTAAHATVPAHTSPLFKAMEAAIFKDIEPVLATLWVALTVGEIPDLRSLLGGLLVISALVLFSGRSTRGVRLLPEEDL